ncbi:hypothetical protein SXCC_00326 [Gluconacetobacter sp. SXCC-1]|nr:hypothetical protein SXCC_00326 [Gluconacetobacter sp. SXCC-1]
MPRRFISYITRNSSSVDNHKISTRIRAGFEHCRQTYRLN